MFLIQRAGFGLKGQSWNLSKKDTIAQSRKVEGFSVKLCNYVRKKYSRYRCKRLKFFKVLPFVIHTIFAYDLSMHVTHPKTGTSIRGFVMVVWISSMFLKWTPLRAILILENSHFRLHSQFRLARSWDSITSMCLARNSWIHRSVYFGALW